MCACKLYAFKHKRTHQTKSPIMSVESEKCNEITGLDCTYIMKCNQNTLIINKSLCCIYIIHELKLNSFWSPGIYMKRCISFIFTVFIALNSNGRYAPKHKHQIPCVVSHFTENGWQRLCYIHRAVYNWGRCGMHEDATACLTGACRLVCTAKTRTKCPPFSLWRG